MGIKAVASVFCVCLILFSSCIPVAFAENASVHVNISEDSDVESGSNSEQEYLNDSSQDFNSTELNKSDLNISELNLSEFKESEIEVFNETNFLNSMNVAPYSFDHVDNWQQAIEPELNSQNAAYFTSLSSGAAIYNYELEVPDNVIGFQPNLSFSYNSHSAGGTYGWLGDGWSLNENYILRKVNYTPTNVNDDTYQLIFNGASYDLIYNSTDGLYHTEVESYLYIKKETGGNNIKKEYWIVKSNDGVVFRFGYNNDSELLNPVSGRSYVSKWYMDQIQDVNGNLIHYNYVENPTAGEISATYLNTISYNNGIAVIGFIRSPKTTVFNTYREGCQYKEMNVLSDVSMYVDSQLLRRYGMSYNTSKNHILLESITLFGSDNSSSLPPTIFTYSGRSEGFYSPNFLYLPYPLRVHGESTGAVFTDLTGNGLPDLVLNGTPYNRTGTWINNVLLHSAVLHLSDPRHVPAYITENGTDTGARFVDLNGDGFTDLVQNSRVGSKTYNNSWINNGYGQFTLNTSWRIPAQIINNSSNRGVNFIDVNGDGLIDIVQNTVTPIVNNTWINTGSGFSLNASWKIPVATLNNSKDQGVRFADINGDGLTDVIQNSINPTYNRTWINTGSGFVLNAGWNTPAAFVNKSMDQGVRFMEINGDGLIDIVQFSKNPNVSNSWINTGYGFVLDNTISFPRNFSFADGGETLSYVIIDMNGDGLSDLITEKGETNSVNDSYFKAASVSGETVPPCRLTGINHSTGAKTAIKYDFSSTFNNTDETGKERMSSKIWVVSSVTTVPGNSQQNIVTNYSYSGGVYHVQPKGKSEFRGFNKVTVSGSNQATSEHYFHQTEGRKGLEYQTVTYADSLLHKDISYEYQETVSNGVYTVNLIGTREKLYNKDGSFITAQTNYTYDSYGNVREVIHHGDISVTGDERKVMTEYVYNVNKWILTTVKTVTMYDASNQQIAKSSIYYDGSSSLTASPSKGLITKTVSWNNQGQDEELKFEYDSFGNLIKQTDGKGLITQTNYVNPEIAVYPLSVVNAKGQTTLFTYDPVSENLLSATDPNGFMTKYQYDIFGRIQKIIYPYDSVISPSIEYTYNQTSSQQYIKIAVKDNESRTLDTYEYFDGLGNVIKIETIGSNNKKFIQEMKYNQHGATEITAPYAGSETKLVTTYRYSDLGNLIEIVNPNATSRRVVYDGLTVTKFDENNHRISYVYDLYQNIQKIIEYNGDEIYETRYEYDSLDNLIKIIPHQTYDQSGVSFVESGNEYVFPDYFILDSNTAVVQFSELRPGEELILNISAGAGSGTRPANPNIFSFYDNFNTVDGWKNTNYNPGAMPSHRGFVDYNTSKYVDGIGLSYNYSGPMEGGEFWYISNDKDTISDGYVFYTRMENEMSQGTYSNSQGYHFSHFGMGNRSSILTQTLVGSNGTPYLAKYFPSYLAFVLEGSASVPWFSIISFTHNDVQASYFSKMLSTDSMFLYKIEYDPITESSVFYVNGGREAGVSDLEAANSSPVSMFFGAQNARNRIDYIAGHKSYQNVSKRQSASNGEIELAVRNTGTQTITNANVEVNISGLNLQNQSLSAGTLAFKKSSNAEVASIQYSSPYRVANTTFTYNSLGQKTQMNDSDLGIWNFEYDSNGNVVRQTDNKGVVTKYEYDALNRITKIDYPSDSDIIYEYDNGTIGTLSNVNSEIMEKSYSYDQRLRVIEEKVTTEADKYIRGDYTINYTSGGSVNPEDPIEPDLPIPDPVSSSFSHVTNFDVQLEENGFFVSELKLTDLRVAMFENDVAYLYLSGQQILKFEDHAGGGNMSIYDGSGELLGLLTPVNGNTDYEDITFNITFTSDGSDVFMEIESSSYWVNPSYSKYEIDLDSISSVILSLTSSWGNYTYISGTYNAVYSRMPELSDPPLIDPVVYTFSHEENIDLDLSNDGFSVKQLKLENLRVSMYIDDVAYLYLNNKRILEFVDHAGGGDLYVYDAEGNLLNIITPVNGNPGYENIVFDIVFTSDGSHLVADIYGNGQFVSPSHSVYSFEMEEPLDSMNLYLDNSLWIGNGSYISADCEIIYEHISSGGGEWDDSEPPEEVSDSFRVSDSRIIELNSGGFSASELNLKNLRTILGQNETSFVYLDDIELLKFENSENGTLSLFDENGDVLDTIYDVNGDPESDNVTFDISFNFEEPETVIILTKYSDGLLVDTHEYSCELSLPVQGMEIVYNSGDENSVEYVTAYQYDSMNRVIGIIYPNGQNSSFTYDERGMLKSISGILDDIKYNSMNLITKKEYSNGVITNLEYDSTSKQLKGIQSKNSQLQSLQDFEYDFDNVGNVIEILDHHDGIYQNFVYDDLDRLVMAGGDDYYQYYAYNPIGSMLAVYDGITVMRFEHGTNAGIHAPTKVDDISLIYDLNGNLVEDERFIYVYDEANFLKIVKDKETDKVIAEFWYDENGQRVKKLESGKASYYINSGYNVEDGKNTIYYFANGERLAKKSVDGMEWYLNDYLGSANVAVDENGNFAERIFYYPFGSYRYVDHPTVSSPQATMTNLFDDSSFTVEKEYDSIGLSEYIQKYDLSNFESQTIDEIFKEAGYESKDLVTYLSEEHYSNIPIKPWKNSSYNLSSNTEKTDDYIQTAEDSASFENVSLKSEHSDESAITSKESDISQLSDFTEFDFSSSKESSELLNESNNSDLNESVVSDVNKSEQSNEFEEIQTASLEERIEAAKKTVNNSSAGRFTSDIIRQKIEQPVIPEILVPTGFKTKDFGSNQSINVYNKQALIHGHKYYISSNMVGNGKDAYTEQFNFSSVLSVNNLKAVHSEHEIDSVSGIFTHYAGDRQEIENILASNMNSDVFSVNSPVLIDLTATFGKGNEPDISWCHENIPYFAGIQTIEVQNTASSTSPYSTASAKYTYTGKEFDSDIGIYYYGARYYNPETFTFTQADSVIPNVYNPQALNRYAYCYNNPITYTDPDGHEPITIATAVTIIAVATIAGGVANGVYKAYDSYSTQKASGNVDMNKVYAAGAGGFVSGSITTLVATTAVASVLVTGGGTTPAILYGGMWGVAGGTGGGMIGRSVESRLAIGQVNMTHVSNPKAILGDIPSGFFSAFTLPVSKIAGIPAKFLPKWISKEAADVAMDTALNTIAVDYAISYTTESLSSNYYNDSSHGGGGDSSGPRYCPVCGAVL